jgi:formate hydrogenlyase subunit 3/multisubunit Na+/H+ antiporter MnhD subunit
MFDMNFMFRPEWMISILFLGALITYFTGKVSAGGRKALAIIFSSYVAILVLFSKTGVITGWRPSYSPVHFRLLLTINPLSWFFAVMLSMVSAMGIIYAAGFKKSSERDNAFYALSLVLMAAMLGVVFSGDMLSFFIFWEIMTLSSYLITTLAGKRAYKASINYMIISTAGAYSMLIGMTMIYVRFGTLEFWRLATLLPRANGLFLLETLSLIGVGFAVKAALIPFYVWAPPAYSEAPDSFTPVFSGALSKLGPYGFLLFMYGMVGISGLAKMGTFRGISDFGYAIALLGSITAVIATLYAIAQDDIKKLLAYSSVSQLGYVMMGVGIGTSVGVAGGLYHALNHAIFKTTLFMGAGALIYTTGSRKLSDMGGLGTKMPITFLTMLISIFALAGIPLTGGFGSKWLLYEAAIQKKFVFIAPLAFIASVGAFLYSFRILQSAFLGQLPDRLKDAKDPSPLISIPMVFMAALLVLFGIAPGIPLSIIASVESYIGIAPINVSTYSAYLGVNFGAYNAYTVMLVITLSLIVALVIFFMGSKSRRVDQNDTYLAGEVPEQTVDLYMHYSVNFYRPIERLFAPYLRLRLERLYDAFGNGYELISEGIRRIYTGDVQHYVYYVMAFLGLLIAAGWWWL